MEDDALDTQRLYDTLFPYYVEVCAVTQYHKRDAKPGGWGGHATLFVHGAELDRGAGYPRLRLAPESAEPMRADSGVGISVNQIFTNVNWVAVPGRDEFFRGALAVEQVLDEAFYEAAVARAASSGWFTGIKIRDHLLGQKPAAMPLEEFIVRHSIGTDFAMTFARSAYGARLPMSRGAIGAVIDYLNGVNETAERLGYTWNAYTNNCSHVVHNAIAAAGVWDAKHARGTAPIDVVEDLLSIIGAVLTKRTSDFSFPANNFVRAYEAGNERPVDDPSAASRDRDVVRTLRDGWISTRPGGLVNRYPMHPESRNRLFVAGRDPLLFSLPMVWDKRARFEQLTRNPPVQVTDLRANLANFRDRYAAALQHTPDRHGDKKFASDYHRYVGMELERTDALIAEFSRLSGHAAVDAPAMER